MVDYYWSLQPLTCTLYQKLILSFLGKTSQHFCISIFSASLFSLGWCQSFLADTLLQFWVQVLLPDSAFLKQTFTKFPLAAFFKIFLSKAYGRPYFSICKDFDVVEQKIVIQTFVAPIKSNSATFFDLLLEILYVLLFIYCSHNR